jgi:hypothetical protein
MFKKKVPSNVLGVKQSDVGKAIQYIWLYLMYKHSIKKRIHVLLCTKDLTVDVLMYVIDFIKLSR